MRSATARRAALILLLCTTAQLRTAEPVPFAELTYGAADGLLPPAPLADWWRESVIEAAGWWGEANGVTLDGAAALAQLRGLRLVASGLPAADGQLTPAIAGWLREAAPLLAPTLLPVASRWPGFTVQERAGATWISGAQALVPQEAEGPPGLRLALHGPGLAEELRRRLAGHPPEGLSAQELALRLALVERWNPSAALVPGTGAVRGWLEPGLPAAWFTPLDAAVVARLPADTLAWFAVGIAGGRLSGDVKAALTAHGLGTAWPATLVPLADPGKLATALDGTWLVAMSKTEAWARVPRSPALDALVTAFAQAQGLTVPTDRRPVVVDTDLSWACTPGEWILATSPARITTWFDASPRLATQVPADALLAGQADQGLTSLGIAQLKELPWMEPLPSRVFPPSQLAWELGWSGQNANPLRTMFQDLDRAGDHRLCGRAEADRLRITLEGPLLPWVVPGIGIRWFADFAEDEVGKVRLRAELAHLRATGQAAFPGDLIAMLPTAAPERIAAWRAQLAAASGARAVRPVPLMKHLRELPLPWPVSDAERAQIDADRRLVGATAEFDAPDLPGGGDLDMLADPAGLHPDVAQVSRTIAAARALSNAGLGLACHGENAGLVLVERASRLLGQPQDLPMALALLSIAAQRDTAWLVTVVTGTPDQPTLARWLA
ncbi:MAG: hypothetical protein H0X38_09590, partial [Planctomycetes bacterium]|nr:hypothetical protein [Planctomycetota bacterium]